MVEGTGTSLYEAVGGAGFFTELVDHFYATVAGDAVLRPMYPDELAASRQHLALFLMQYWGGPTTYSEVRGHPRLRMRHFHFAIGPAERDAWLAAMYGAVDQMAPAPAVRSALRDYFTMAADHLVNQPAGG
jgi:hemoglobin